MKELKVNEGTNPDLQGNEENPSAFPPVETKPSRELKGYEGFTGCRFTPNDLALIRRVILEVIDEKEWEFYEANYYGDGEEGRDTENRVKFADHIQELLVKEATGVPR